MLEDLEKQLQDQQATVANDIRSHEAALKTLQDTYLKVLGALELIQVQKQQSEEQKEEIVQEP